MMHAVLCVADSLQAQETQSQLFALFQEWQFKGYPGQHDAKAAIRGLLGSSSNAAAGGSSSSNSSSARKK
jgi:hypothetical protein